MPKLIIKNLKSKEEQSFEFNQASILIGRTNTCDIELPVQSVSRRHAEILRKDQEYFVKDLRSGNGTRVNQEKILPDKEIPLNSGDKVQLEDYELEFTLSDESSQPSGPENTESEILEIQLLKKMMSALDSDDVPSLEVLNGDSAGKRFNLNEGQSEWTLGRGENCEITIPENVLSRQHSKLEAKWGGIVVTDLNSKNGTFINQKPVKEKILHDGDRLMLGTIKLLYRNPKEVKAQITQKELEKKKKEAALLEAEKLAEKQKEEEEKAKQMAAEEQARKEAEAKEVEAALEKEPEQEKKEVQTQEPTPAPGEKPKLSNIEKLMILLGILVGVIALVGIFILIL